MTLGAGEPVTIQRRVPVVPIGIVSFSGSTRAVGASSVVRNILLMHTVHVSQDRQIIQDKIVIIS